MQGHSTPFIDYLALDVNEWYDISSGRRLQLHPVPRVELDDLRVRCVLRHRHLSGPGSTYVVPQRRDEQRGFSNLPRFLGDGYTSKQ